MRHSVWVTPLKWSANIQWSDSPLNCIGWLTTPLVSQNCYDKIALLTGQQNSIFRPDFWRFFTRHLIPIMIRMLSIFGFYLKKILMEWAYKINNLKVQPILSVSWKIFFALNGQVWMKDKMQVVKCAITK